MNRSLILAGLLLAARTASAQDDVVTPFKAAPLTVNPALTGMFNGNIRVSAAYLYQPQSATMPYAAVAAGADMPVIVTKNGNYLAAGLQTMNSWKGDGNMRNAAYTASLAWHMPIGKVRKDYAHELAVGIQGCYAASSIDLAYINSISPAISQEYNLGIGNIISYYGINAGLGYSQSVGSRLNYTIGLAGYNLNRPASSFDRGRNELAGLLPTYVGSAGANWALSSRVTLQPAFLYKHSSKLDAFTAGTEVQYNLRKIRTIATYPFVFAGAWYRDGDVATVTAGVGVWALRLGAAYNYYYGNSGTKTGGFQIQCSFIAPRRNTTPSLRTVPCDRF